jgi:penicillin amidase
MNTHPSSRPFMPSGRARVILVVTLVVLAALAVITPLVVRSAATGTRDSIPNYRVPGLGHDVTVTVDTAGIPHVAADTEADAMAGLCWAMARDRFFQMEFNRLAAEGRLAEHFGRGPDDTLLQQDLLNRTLDFPGIAAAQWTHASAHTRLVLSACARGINAWRDRAIATGTLPLEFALLGFTPGSWAPQDSVAVAAFFLASLDTPTWSSKLVRGALAQSSPALATALIPDATGPTMFDAQGQLTPISAYLGTPTPRSPMPAMPAMPATSSKPAARAAGSGAGGSQAGDLRPVMSALAALPLGGGRASNNWAIAGSLTASGQPLLANDPHLALTVPSLAYLAAFSIRGGPSVEGLSLAGTPFSYSAHNQWIGYTASLALTDDADVYQEKTRTTASGGIQVLYNGSWVEATTRTDQIEIAPEQPGGTTTTQSLPITVTPHGPLLNAALPGGDQLPPVALKLGMNDSSWSLDALFNLALARDWPSFRRAATAGMGGGFSLIFADSGGTHGHLGYQMTAFVPIRDAANALYPVPG